MTWSECRLAKLCQMLRLNSNVHTLTNLKTTYDMKLACNDKKNPNLKISFRNHIYWRPVNFICKTLSTIHFNQYYMSCLNLDKVHEPLNSEIPSPELNRCWSNSTLCARVPVRYRHIT